MMSSIWKNSLIKYIFLVGVFLLPLQNQEILASEQITIKVIARTVYEDFSRETKSKTLLAAKKIALEKFFQTQPISAQQAKEQFSKEFYKNIDKFVIDAVILQEKNNEDTSTYSIAVSASINSKAIKAFFISNSAAGNQKTGTASDFGAMFIARKIVDERVYDAKRTDVMETDSTQSQVEENSDSANRSASSRRDKTFDVKRTGGSTRRRSTEIKYVPDQDLSDDVEDAVTQALTTAGFTPMPLDGLENVPLLDEIKFSKSGRLKRRDLRKFRNAAIDAGWTFFGMGTVDIGAPRRDRARNIVKVSAKVSFKVWLLTDGRAKRVVSVRPITVYGSDANDDGNVATSNAANAAVKKVMNEAVSQLQQKGLR